MCIKPYKCIIKFWIRWYQISLDQPLRNPDSFSITSDSNLIKNIYYKQSSRPNWFYIEWTIRFCGRLELTCSQSNCFGTAKTFSNHVKLDKYVPFISIKYGCVPTFISIVVVDVSVFGQLLFVNNSVIRHFIKLTYLFVFNCFCVIMMNVKT